MQMNKVCVRHGGQFTVRDGTYARQGCSQLKFHPKFRIRLAANGNGKGILPVVFLLGLKMIRSGHATNSHYPFAGIIQRAQ
jgi:hypothetical protein